MSLLTLVSFALLASSAWAAEIPLEHRNASTRAYEQFRADFSRGSMSAAFGVGLSYGAQNCDVWASGGGVDVRYPAGSYKPSASPQGGFGLFTNHKVYRQATFKYSVFFPAGFNFVKGGKLPGLYGGKRSCTGGDPANDCFSTRLMWRERGLGEAYLYANRQAQDPSICQNPANYCNPDFGWSLNKGAWTFQTGVWTEVSETVRLNDVGQRNGVLSIKINGREVIRYDIIVYRIPAYPNMAIDGLDVETFFGGGSPDWATPTHQTVEFKDFILINED